MLEIGRHLGGLDAYSHVDDEDKTLLVNTLEEILFEGPSGCLPAIAELLDPRVHKIKEKRFQTITRIAELPNTEVAKEVLGRVIEAGILTRSKADALDMVNKGLAKVRHHETEVWIFAELATEMMMVRKNAANGQFTNSPRN